MAPRLTGMLRQWMQNDAGYPSNWMPDIIRTLPKQSIHVVPAGAGVAEMKEQYGSSLNILLAVCGMVLLIGCANVANLLLARSVTRRPQTAVRLAMGATRRQIVMQALTESVLLAIGGCIAGLGVAAAAVRLLLALAFQHTHFLPIHTAPSLAVLASSFAMALLLAAVGLYGVTAYGVAQRKNEIGIRMALGADRASVVGLVLRGTSTRVLAGLLLGVPLAAGAGRRILHPKFPGFRDPGAQPFWGHTAAMGLIPRGKPGRVADLIALWEAYERRDEKAG
jgi:ABC-type antimicrobial peptide transport system permease subunit